MKEDFKDAEKALALKIRKTADAMWEELEALGIEKSHEFYEAVNSLHELARRYE